MFARHLTLYVVALAAFATAGTPVASAEPPSVTPVMQKAFTHYEAGPEDLRRFVYRTRMIYELDYAQVVKAYEAVRTALAPAAPEDARVASTEPERR